MKTITISAKCSDSFFASLNDDHKGLVGEYDGYVPDFFPGNHYGDYVDLEIDIETGTILNWNVPTKEDLKIFS
jgi:hypothetical protein